MPVPMETEPLSDDDDFPDPSYDESEMFSHDDHYETKRNQREPLSKCSEFSEFEPPYDKTNKMACAPSKDSISLGIRQV